MDLFYWGARRQPTGPVALQVMSLLVTAVERSLRVEQVC